MAAFPPQRLGKATPLSHDQAQAWLSTYLQNSERDAHLQPDALLTASGPVRTQGMSSVTIHNMRRLQAGLNGKYDVNELQAELPEADQLGKPFKGAIINIDELREEEDWQNKSEYEREQVVETGDIADRDHAHGVSKGPVAPTEVSTSTNGVIDKEARKKAKKARKLSQKASQREPAKD